MENKEEKCDWRESAFPELFMKGAGEAMVSLQMEGSQLSPLPSSPSLTPVAQSSSTAAALARLRARLATSPPPPSSCSPSPSRSRPPSCPPSRIHSRPPSPPLTPSSPTPRPSAMLQTTTQVHTLPSGEDTVIAANRMEEVQRTLLEVVRRVENIEERFAVIAIKDRFDGIEDLTHRLATLEGASSRDNEALRDVQLQLAELNESVQVVRLTLIRKMDSLLEANCPSELTLSLLETTPSASISSSVTMDNIGNRPNTSASTTDFTSVAFTTPSTPAFIPTTTMEEVSPIGPAKAARVENQNKSASGIRKNSDTVSPTPSPTIASLLTAAEEGNSELLLWLLETGADVRERNKNGDTALHVAASRGNERLVLHLVGAGLAVDSPGRYRRTPLHCAASRGHAGVVKRLLMAGAKVDSQDVEGDTPLLIAARQGYVQTVLELIRSGRYSSITDKSGRSPIMWAACNGHAEVVSLLMHNATLSKTDRNGDTALLLASKSGHWEVVELLAQSGVALDARDKKGNTVMLYAAKAGEWSVLRLLLDLGASATTSEFAEESPLMLAAENGREEEIRELLRHGGAQSDRELVKALARAKVAAVLWAFEDAVPGLLRGPVGQEAMRQAAHDGRVETLVALLEAGVEINAANRYGHTALHLASHMGRKDCLSLLLRRGASRDCKDREGSTPLHYATREGHEDCVRVLLDAGANVLIKDKKNTTPLDLETSTAMRELLTQYTETLSHLISERWDDACHDLVCETQDEKCGDSVSRR